MPIVETDQTREPNSPWRESRRHVVVVLSGGRRYLAARCEKPGRELTCHDLEMLESTGAEIVETRGESEPLDPAGASAADGGWLLAASASSSTPG